MIPARVWMRNQGDDSRISSYESGQYPLGVGSRKNSSGENPAPSRAFVKKSLVRIFPWKIRQARWCQSGRLSAGPSWDMRAVFSSSMVVHGCPQMEQAWFSSGMDRVIE